MIMDNHSTSAIKLGLHTAFIDSAVESTEDYQPQFITNRKEQLEDDNFEA